MFLIQSHVCVLRVFMTAGPPANKVSELFTLVDADTVGFVDVPCEDETGMHSDKYTCFTDLAR